MLICFLSGLTFGLIASGQFLAAGIVGAATAVLVAYSVVGDIRAMRRDERNRAARAAERCR